MSRPHYPNLRQLANFTDRLAGAVLRLVVCCAWLVLGFALLLVVVALSE